MRRKLVHFRSGFSTSRVKAIRPPARRCVVGDGVAGGGGDVDGTTARSDGDGVTTDVKRMSPAPAASPPPTTRTAATASSVKFRRRAIGRSGIGAEAGIAMIRSRISAGARSLSPTSAAYQACSRSSSSRSVIGRSP